MTTRKFQTFRFSDRKPPITDYFSSELLSESDPVAVDKRQVFEVNSSAAHELFRRFSPGIVGVFFAAASVHFSHKHGLFDGIETHDWVGLKFGVWTEARRKLLDGSLFRQYGKRLVPYDGYYIRAKRPEAQDWQRLREQVFLRDGNLCRYCGEPSTDPHCDHVIPIAAGGNNQLHNLATACPPCNLDKGCSIPEAAQ